MAKVILTEVRLAFPKLFKAVPVGNGDNKYYSAAAPIEPGSKNHQLLEAACQEASKEKWGAKAPQILATIREKGDTGYKHSPLKNAEGDVYDGFQGQYSLNASRREDKGAPLVLDRNKSPLAESSGKPYGGCYVNMVVEVWAQDNSNGKRVNVELKAVQFVKDGDAFGGGAPASADDLPDLGVAEETADLF